VYDDVHGRGAPRVLPLLDHALFLFPRRRDLVDALPSSM
jgi:hypothetical protein